MLKRAAHLHRLGRSQRFISNQRLTTTANRNSEGHETLLSVPIENSKYGKSKPFKPLSKPVPPAKQVLKPGCPPGYQPGGYLQPGNDETLNITDKADLLKWGETSIPIRFFAPDDNTAVSLPHFWLRDNCRCTSCVNQDTMQRSFDTFAIPKTIQPTEVVTEADGLRVTWENDGHISLYPWEWLQKHAVPNHLVHEIPSRKWNDNGLVYWGAEIKDNPPSVHYDEIMAADSGVGNWTDKIRRYGFCYVDGCPVSPEKTQQLLERIAFIRVTHYGGFYDFTADLTMKDTAYTTLALGPHTDTTYFTDPAGLQMFHLLSHTAGTGGASLLVDGFKAARSMFQRFQPKFHVLAKTPIPWHASGNEGITITPTKPMPVFTLSDPDGICSQKMVQVRWNNDDRGVVENRSIAGSTSKKDTDSKYWYDAARTWDQILKDEKEQYWAQLEPGRPLIFDNWRVLHGRSSFTGKRRICGGYVNHDDYISRWRNTNFSKKEVLEQIL